MTKKQEIESMLIAIYLRIGIDKPQNHDEILDFVVEDVDETADPEDWHSGDVDIAFRRWMESKEEPDNDNYFKIIHQGFQKELLREEIQIHAGEYGNVFLIKTEDGFIVDVYGNGDHVNTMAIYEEDLEPSDEDNEEIVEILPSEIDEFLDEWGQTVDEVCEELGYNLIDSEELLKVNYFWYTTPVISFWIPKESSMYSEKEQMIANFLRFQ